jgi:hypothetical protein
MPRSHKVSSHAVRIVRLGRRVKEDPGTAIAVRIAVPIIVAVADPEIVAAIGEVTAVVIVATGEKAAGPVAGVHSKALPTSRSKN